MRSSLQNELGLHNIMLKNLWGRYRTRGSGKKKKKRKMPLGGSPFNVSLWENHPSAHGTILAASDSEENDQYYCRALDLENDGKCTARFLGNGGTINQLSTSKGDPNLFVTAADDALARLYDVRQPLPVLTIQTGAVSQNCTSAVVCHPDGIPCMSTSSRQTSACSDGSPTKQIYLPAKRKTRRSHYGTSAPEPPCTTSLRATIA